MDQITTPNNPSSVALGGAWQARAGELATWAWECYVVRDDVWGGYTPLRERGQKRRRADRQEYTVGPTGTCPAKRKRGIVKLTLAIIEQHFRATRPEQVIGAPTTSPDNFCKFGTIEVDYHGENSNAPEINLRASLGWYQQLRERGFRPLL
jgi:hypothetical protein